MQISDRKFGLFSAMRNFLTNTVAFLALCFLPNALSNSVDQESNQGRQLRLDLETYNSMKDLISAPGRESALRQQLDEAIEKLKEEKQELLDELKSKSQNDRKEEHELEEIDYDLQNIEALLEEGKDAHLMTETEVAELLHQFTISY